MPRFANDRDKSSWMAMERWQQAATYEIDNMLHGAADGTAPSMPHHFWSDTMAVSGFITANTKLDPTPLHDLYAASLAWQTDGSAATMPPRPKLESILDLAILAIGSASAVIFNRIAKEPAADRQEAADERTPASPAGSKRGMTVEQADAEAKKQVKKLRKSFFSKSKRQQAELIGCHHLTWEQTPLFQSAVKKGLIPAPQPRAPKAVSLTKNREAVTGEGGKDEVLHQLVADSAADYEPSPLLDDPPGRERKVRSRKRL